MKLATIVGMAALALTASSVASGATDPRVCATVTPGGPSRHAYYCAQAAAKSAVAVKLARINNVRRWYYPIFCNEAGSQLRWRCSLLNAKPYTTATVTFRKTTAGWARTVTLK